MKQYVFCSVVTMLLLLNGHGLLAQQTMTIDQSSGKLSLHAINEVEVIGYDGSTIEITTDLDQDHDEMERAKGMRILSPGGLQDNTGIGLFQEVDGNEVKLTQVSVNLDRVYYIKVPNGVNVFYKHETYHGDDFYVRDFSGELEATVHHNDIILQNISGPCSINTLHGSINASFTQLPSSGSITLHSAHDDVDVALPNDGKATVNLSSTFGTIFTDLDIEVQEQDGDMRKLRGGDIRGTLNGGGLNISIESTHDNIYLRKS